MPNIKYDMSGLDLKMIADNLKYVDVFDHHVL